MLKFNRPVLCSWRRCHKVLEDGEQRLTLTWFEGHRYITALCSWHFSLLDRANRIRFWRRHRRPDIAGTRVGRHLIYAMYTQKPNVITVTEHFAHEDGPQQIYHLTHETLHWVLSREFGMMSSISLDVFYKQPLKVLGGHSLHTWMLNSLYEQTETPKL